MTVAIRQHGGERVHILAQPDGRHQWWVGVHGSSEDERKLVESDRGVHEIEEYMRSMSTRRACARSTRNTVCGSAKEASTSEKPTGCKKNCVKTAGIGGSRRGCSYRRVHGAGYEEVTSFAALKMTTTNTTDEYESNIMMHSGQLSWSRSSTTTT